MTAITNHLDIHDHVEQLVSHHTHREPYEHRNGLVLQVFTHLTMVPPLIVPRVRPVKTFAHASPSPCVRIAQSHAMYVPRSDGIES